MQIWNNAKSGPLGFKKTYNADHAGIRSELRRRGIGDAPVITIPYRSGEIILKDERNNPTGTVKDRTASALLDSVTRLRSESFCQEMELVLRQICFINFLGYL